MIFGGPTEWDSNRVRKSSSRMMKNCEVIEKKIQTEPIISFGPEDMHWVSDRHNDALIIWVMIANYEVARIFVEFGISVNVLFKEVMNQMDLGQYKVEPVITALFGFMGHAINPLGMINLPLYLGEENTRKTQIVSFIVVEAHSAYNSILERPAMTTFMTVASAFHMKIKFPVGNTVGEVRGNQKIVRKCYMVEIRVEQKVARTEQPNSQNPRAHDQLNMIDKGAQVTTEEECEKVIIYASSGEVQIVKTLGELTRDRLLKCLKENKDVFAWSASDLKGVRPKILEHRLNALSNVQPVIQKKRHFGPEKDSVILKIVE